ncbi:L-threonine ammonia-lyase-like isoform X2 [Homalodisca vitripennis]|nr:L-threonine ammonia-lyase-like isoform X2 [Homalodisca vitripennis]
MDMKNEKLSPEEEKLNKMSLEEKLKIPVSDPACVPEKPVTVTFAEVTSAAFKIKENVVRTPCGVSHMSESEGMEIFLKQDFLQRSGSFKERGACYALMMLPEAQKKKGVIAASAGNHAQALCYHGKKLGIPVTVVMPVFAPIMKIQACYRFGGKVIVEGSNMQEARHVALVRASKLGLTYINGYDHPHIIAGQGTIGLEIIEQVQDVDAVVIPIGGGGLIAGAALAIKSLRPNCKIIGVESDRCPGFATSMSCGKPTIVSVMPSLADGLAVPLVGVNAFQTARPYIDKVVVVKEEWIAIAILRMVEMEKCVVEGAGAIGLAAILAGHLSEFKGKRVVLTVSGGNIDTTVLGRCLDRGLTADGRLLKFSVVVSDRAGSIAELCTLLADVGVTVKDILQERAWLKNDVFSVKVKIVCEARNIGHCKELMKALTDKYDSVSFAGFMQTLDSNIRTMSTPDLTSSPFYKKLHMSESGSEYLM